MSLSENQTFSSNLEIVTVDSPHAAVLYQKTENFDPEELPLAKEIAEKLFQAINDYLPAAGLAAPQIGISRSIFIYSYDRDPKNLEVVINPSYVPIGEATIQSWEGCFSSLLCEKAKTLANIPRFEKIRATYLNLDGILIEKDLESFEAKVFQHEYDHLMGMVNIHRPDAKTKSFETEEELMSFMNAIKQADSKHYKH